MGGDTAHFFFNEAMLKSVANESLVKKILFPLLIVSMGLFGAVYWISDNLDETIAESISRLGSAMTQAKLGVERVEIAPSNGKGLISGLVVGNPRGYRSPYAFRAERIELDVDLATVNQDVTVIRVLIIDKPEVIYEKSDGTTNFDALQKNIAAYLGLTKGRNRGNTLIIVEELIICNASAQASADFMGGKTLSIPLADIALKNVGKARGGVTPGELAQVVANALKTKLNVAGNFDRLRKSTGHAIDQASLTIRDPEKTTSGLMPGL